MKLNVYIKFININVHDYILITPHGIQEVILCHPCPVLVRHSLVDPWSSPDRHKHADSPDVVCTLEQQRSM